MRKIKELLRLKYTLGLSNRDIGHSIKVSSSTVYDCLKRAKGAGITWPVPEDLDDTKLEQLLYEPTRNRVPKEASSIDWNYIHREMSRKGVTIKLLWEEYSERQPEGLSYSRFSAIYREWRKQVNYSMHQVYKAGEKLLVDYAGMTVSIIDTATGEIWQAQIFVAVQGTSSLIFAEATASQSLEDWIGSHRRAFEYYGGVNAIVIPDNLKSGVHKAHRYEPELNPSYADMAEYYGIAVMPTRVSSPKDKATAEKAVQDVERRILAKLRNIKFFTLAELNASIKPLLKELNNALFQKRPGSRRSQFEALDKPKLRPLPKTPYQFAYWKKAKLGIDYHVALDKHYYSAPYTLIKKELQIRYTATSVEVFYKGNRMASHVRQYMYGHTTLEEHMPKAHREYAKWTPEKIIAWANRYGESVSQLVAKMIASRVHPEQAYRSCVGIIRLADKFSRDRLEKACARAIAIGAYSYKSVKSILDKSLDDQPLTSCQNNYTTNQDHKNLRGRNYYV